MGLGSPSSFTFSRLPTELQIKIFILDTYIYDPDYVHDHKRAMKLGAVCGEWREIVWSTPEIWTTIILYFGHRQRWSNLKSVLDLYIKNSKDFLLVIDFDFHSYVLNQESTEELHLLEVLDDLTHEAHRIKVLDITFSWDDTGEICSKFSQFAQRNVPLLEAVKLRHLDSCGRRWEVFEVEMENMFSNSPQLRHLGISQVSLNLDAFASCTQVTTIAFGGVTIQNCLQAVSSLPNVTVARFRDIKQFEDFELPDRYTFDDGSSIFIHRALESLQMDIEDGDVSALFLRSIACPSLHILCIENRYQEHEATNLSAVAQLLRVSNCPLTDLDLEMKHFGTGIWPILDRVHTTLEFLRLTTKEYRYQTGYDTLHALVRKLRSPSYLPQLIRLYIKQKCGPLNYASIYKYLRRRMDTWPVETEICPTEIKIIVGYDNPLHYEEGFSYEPTSERINREVVTGFKSLRKSGMEVSFRAMNFHPNPILRRYNAKVDDL